MAARKARRVTRKGRVAGYNPDTGHGVVYAEDANGKFAERFPVSFKAFPDWLSTLDPGEEVEFEVEEDEVATIRPLNPRTPA
jgi:cold shock CspA family protein